MTHRGRALPDIIIPSFSLYIFSVVLQVQAIEHYFMIDNHVPRLLATVIGHLVIPSRPNYIDFQFQLFRKSPAVQHYFG